MLSSFMFYRCCTDSQQVDWSQIVSNVEPGVGNEVLLKSYSTPVR